MQSTVKPRSQLMMQHLWCSVVILPGTVFSQDGPPVLAMRVSLDGKTLALQRSAHLLEFVDLASGNVFVHGSHKGRQVDSLGFLLAAFMTRVDSTPFELPTGFVFQEMSCRVLAIKVWVGDGRLLFVARIMTCFPFGFKSGCQISWRCYLCMLKHSMLCTVCVL